MIGEPVHQRGAHGLVAECECAGALHERLTDMGLRVDGSAALFCDEMNATIRRVAHELSPALVLRAQRHGRALGDHIAECLGSQPPGLGLVLARPVSELMFQLTPVGHLTNSGTPATSRRWLRSSMLPPPAGPLPKITCDAREEK